METNVIQSFCSRPYNPESGRFLSEDPIGFSGRDENFYRYVFNSPINLIDPTGMFVVCTRGPAVNYITCTNYLQGSDKFIPLEVTTFEIDVFNPPFNLFGVYSDEEFEELMRISPQQCSI